MATMCPRRACRWLLVVLVAALIALSVVWFGLARGVIGTETSERITNGSFEQRFGPDGVGVGWNGFDNGGAARYGWYRDAWTPVVYEGASSQLIEINTRGMVASDADRYAGIYQIVRGLVPGATYQFALRGMMRVLEGDSDRANWSYSVEWGYTAGNNSNWQSVANWQETPWSTVYSRLSPGTFLSYRASLVAPGDTITLFIRARKKWGTVGRELDLNLDTISLVGTQPATARAPEIVMTPPPSPGVGRLVVVPVRAKGQAGLVRIELYSDGTLVSSQDANGQAEVEVAFRWQPVSSGQHTLVAVARDAFGEQATAKAIVGVVDVREHVQNGGFEGGFQAGGTAGGWLSFDNGGRAGYRFGAETWPAAIYDGQSAQTIAISTEGQAASDPDRYAGIFQTIGGLTPGATYEISLRGLLRAREGDSDIANYAYRVQWGFTLDGGQDWRAVQNWQEVPWDTIYPRSSPGAYTRYRTTVQAPPGGALTLFIRAWKKWATVNREFILDLDAASLVGP
ncbi:MAG: hypothetical protein M5U01_42140 [Ardenticatenaceae bacterium]|nr:hypothetical protein [Ardenticatenaceae bacterium]